MLKSMYSGVSGMKANQTKMDVIGNNIANIGTTAFKKSSVRFADSLNETLINASQADGIFGSVNPGQVGIGTKVSSIAKHMTQGSIQHTGRPTDIALDGDGFFTLDLGDGKKGYTRDGSFNIDINGNLVTGDGYKVLDKAGKEITIKSDEYVNFSISKEGQVTGIKKDGTKVDIAKIEVVNFPNPEGLEALGGNIYSSTVSSGVAVSDSTATVIQGAIELSNVDLSEEFTEMIVTTRAFQAASKVITTSDELLQEILNIKR